MENVIEARNVKKEFRTVRKKAGLRGSLKGLFSREYIVKRALNGVSFEVKEGEFVGMIGPNGAGKSTLVKVLTGILTPSSGKVRVLGYVPYEQRQDYAQYIGVVFGQRTQLWWDLPVKDTFDLLRHIYAIPEKDYRENMKRFTEILGLDKYLHQPVRKLSLGERMRCDLAASLLHNPKVVFLDEPTIGLDVEAKFRIRQFLKEQNKKGTTIILTTHDMGDIEELCPRMIIIDKGGIIYDGLTSDIAHRISDQRALVVDFKEPSPRKISLPKGAKIVSREGDRVVININLRKTDVATAIKHVLRRYRVDDIATEEPSIEETIRKVYREGVR
ncbi:MAG: ATP-binding cassette domain-containing protein [Candidatus Aenigmatarchaeota archaeon]